jgi:predicted MFS family arabinose efflux permease
VTAFGSRRALVVLAAGATVMAVALGIRHAFGLFLQPMSVQNGWSREAFALAIAAQNLVWGVVQPFTGMLADRLGAARVMIAGALLYAAGLALMAVARTPGDLMLSAGLLIGLALSATTFAVVLGAVSRAVPESQRTMAMGVAVGIGSFGQFALLPGSLALIESLGWAGALTVLAVLVAATVVPARAMTRGPAAPALHAPIGARAALREALAHRGFWLLCGGFFVCGFHVIFITTHLPAYLMDRGLPLALGTTVLALLGLANVAGAWLGGLWGQRYRKPAVLSAIYLGRAVVIAAFVSLPVSSASACIFAVVIGLLWMSTVPLTNGTVASVFGVQNMSMLGGVVFLCHQLGAFFGGWLGGRVYDATGSYDAVWMIAIGLSLAAAAVNLPIREQPVARLRAAGAAG